MKSVSNFGQRIASYVAVAVTAFAAALSAGQSAPSPASSATSSGSPQTPLLSGATDNIPKGLVEPSVPPKALMKPATAASSTAGTAGAPGGNLRGIPEADRKKLEGLIADETGSALKDDLFPLSSTQLRELIKRTLEQVETVHKVEAPKARPVLRAMTADFSTRAGLGVIRVERGMTSSISFTDGLGNPWPVDAARTGDREVITLGPRDDEVPKDLLRNTVTLEVATRNGAFRSTNLSVFLRGQKAPLVFWVLPNQAEVDFRVDVTVPGLVPGAAAPIAAVSDVKHEAVLSKLLSGTPAPEAGLKPVRVVRGSKPGTEFYTDGTSLFVLSRDELLTPQPQARLSNVDGMTVYRAPRLPVIMFAGGAGQAYSMEVAF